MNFPFTAVISGTVAALLVDLGAFVRARESNKLAQFDYVLAFSRALMGALSGLGVGIGANLAS